MEKLTVNNTPQFLVKSFGLICLIFALFLFAQELVEKFPIRNAIGALFIMAVLAAMVSKFVTPKQG